MSHLDPEQLALLALDEPVASATDDAHLASCATCTADLATLRHAVTVGRAAIDDASLEVPHDRVWERIAEELEFAPAPTPPASEPSPVEEARRQIRPRRRPRTVWVLAASLAFLVAIGGSAWALTRTILPTEVAAASLIAFPDHPDAEGTATAEEYRDGTIRLHVTLDDNPPGNGFREVWLIRGDASAMVSLGILDGDDGTFTVPVGIDLADYSLVDISEEPLDGDPLHSGDSIVRGELTSV